VHRLGEPYPYRDAARAYRKCSSFSRVFKFPRCYHRNDREKRGIEIVTGGNASLRRSAVERFGLWDETTVEGEEASFCFRLMRHKRPSEYLVFSPVPLMIRRLDIAGGLARRTAGSLAQLWLHFEYAHRSVGRYFPVRFALLYPLFLLRVLWATIEYTWEDARYPTTRERVLDLARLLVLGPPSFAWFWVRLLRKPAGRRYAPGQALAANVS
jgi:hypothetical protein